MSNYNSLKTTIDANIKQNGKQEITGQILNSVLNQMVTTLGAGYQFAGVATTATNPGSPDAKVFYIANGKGTYTNFSGLEVTEDEVVVLYWDSSWHKVSTGIASQAKLSELGQEVDEKLDKELDSDTLLIVDGNGNIIAQIDANGVNSVDVRVKIDGELVSVKSLLATLKEGLATEKLRAETEEAKKLDKELDADALVITDDNGYIIAQIDANGVHSVNIDENPNVINGNHLLITDNNGYIIARIDSDGIHSAQSKHSVACMVLSDNYYPTAAPTRDSDGNVTHAEVMFATGVEGEIDITYSNGLSISVDVNYGDYTYTITINRDSDGNVTTVLVN